MKGRREEGGGRREEGEGTAEKKIAEGERGRGEEAGERREREELRIIVWLKERPNVIS